METKADELAFHIRKLEKALVTLDEILDQPFTIIVRDATIQRFEYCFELAWKMFKKALKIEGIEVNSPRQAVRGAYASGYIENADIWLEMLEDRNMTAHTYDPDIAQQVYESAKLLPDEIRNALRVIKQL